MFTVYWCCLLVFSFLVSLCLGHQIVPEAMYFPDIQLFKCSCMVLFVNISKAYSCRIKCVKNILRVCNYVDCYVVVDFCIDSDMSMAL